MCKKITDEPLLVRLDSGNDAAGNIGILVEVGCHFIIKRNLRKESKEGWLKMAQEHSKDVEPPGKERPFILEATGNRLRIKQRMAREKTSPFVPVMRLQTVPLINMGNSFWKAA